MIPGVLSVLEGMEKARELEDNDSEEKKMGEMILFMVLVVILTTVAGLRTALAETVTLQQGADEYAGCAAETLWGADVAEVDDYSLLYLRGAHNCFRVRFEIPADLADKTLARAQLRLFLPEARTPNTFTEIFCHEITTPGEQISVDEQTDYDNGRRPGAVDSVELFAPPGPGWKHFPYLPLGVPEGGKWIEFNITQLVEKWINDPTANHGVLLVPTDCPDRRFPSTWEIDIPSASFDDNATHRPKLLMEFAPVEQDYLVGMTHSLTRICDRSTRYGYSDGYGTEYRLSMAQNEFEGFQVVIYPMLEDLKNVRFAWTDLTSEGGDTIPAADLEYFVEDWYQLRRNWMTRDVFFAGKLYETTDPLIPEKSRQDVCAPRVNTICRQDACAPRHTHTPFFFRVHTRPETPAGSYSGTITVQSDNAEPVQLSLTVKVWPYAIPEKWNFHTMGQFIWRNVERFHGDDFDDELARKYYDFLMDHRFSPTEQYSHILSPRTMLDYCLDRGMNTVYLSGNFTGSDAEMEQAEKDYKTVKELQTLDYTLMYIGDETDQWDEMRRRANLIHARLPGVMAMIGGSLPNKELTGHIDIYDPHISGSSKIYSLHHEKADVVRQAQERGEEFYWYVACGPAYPYPNVQVEFPLISSRVLFWMTWKYAVTGFEYYCYNIWERNYSSDPANRYPNAKWKADGWSVGWETNGDGMLFYPGPISSLRFEAIRDGIEDWESHLVLRDCVAAVKNRKGAAEHRDLMDRAEKLLKMSDEIVADFSHYTLEPERLLVEREKLGDLIAELMEIVPQTQQWDAGAYTYDKAVEVRIARQTALRRKMLRERHLKACQELNVEPLPQDAWDELWPKRVLFEQDFESEGDWDGRHIAAKIPGVTQHHLAGHDENRYFAKFIRVGIRYDHARAATTTWIKFRYLLTRETPLEVMLFDLTQGDNYAARITDPVVDEWTEVIMKVTGEFRRKDGSSAIMEAGDAIDDIFFGAGAPGDGTVMLIGEVILLGRD